MDGETNVGPSATMPGTWVTSEPTPQAPTDDWGQPTAAPTWGDPSMANSTNGLVDQGPVPSRPKNSGWDNVGIDEPAKTESSGIVW